MHSVMVGVEEDPHDVITLYEIFQLCPDSFTFRLLQFIAFDVLAIRRSVSYVVAGFGLIPLSPLWFCTGTFRTNS